MATDRRLISAVAGHYCDLQGLRLAPLAAIALTLAGVEAGLFGSIPKPAVMIVAAIVGLIGFYWIGRRYEATYGRVSGQAHRGMTAAAAAAAVAAAGAFIVADSIALPIDPLWLVLAIGFGLYWLKLERVFTHHLVAAVVAFAWALAPLAVPGTRDRSNLEMLLSISVFALVIGLFDHWALVRAMRPIPDERDRAVR